MRQIASRKGSWVIGELAKATGVSTDTLRHYERKGVLHSQRAGNGYRQYPEDALERVRMVRQGLAIGFTLDELRSIFQVFDRGGAPCQQVRNLAVSKLAQIELHLQEVTTLRNELKDALKDWDKRLAKTTSGQRAGLLKTLAARNGVGSSSALFLRKPSIKKKGQKA